MIIYIGKARNLTYKELWLIWKFGRPVETLEPIDFSGN